MKIKIPKHCLDCQFFNTRRYYCAIYQRILSPVELQYVLDKSKPKFCIAYELKVKGINDIKDKLKLKLWMKQLVDEGVTSRIPCGMCPNNEGPDDACGDTAECPTISEIAKQVLKEKQ